MKHEDPERWLANPDAAPPGVAELLRAAQPPRSPSAEMRARLASELARLAVSAPPRPLRWPYVSGVAVLAVGAAGWLALSPRAAPSRPAAYPVPAARHEMAPLPSRAVAVAEAPLPVPAVRAAPAAAERPWAPAPPARAAASRRIPPRPVPPRAEPHAPAPTREAQPVADTLAREAALIEAARRTVHAHPAEALKTLETHHREFPAGQLTAEREFLAVAALVQLGRQAEAETRGRRLVSQYPGTTYAERVPAVLGRGRSQDLPPP